MIVFVTAEEHEHDQCHCIAEEQKHAGPAVPKAQEQDQADLVRCWMRTQDQDQAELACRLTTSQDQEHEELVCCLMTTQEQEQVELSLQSPQELTGWRQQAGGRLKADSRLMADIQRGKSLFKAHLKKLNIASKWAKRNLPSNPSNFL